MIGFGTQEIILLLVLGGGAVGAIFLIKFLSSGGSRAEALEEENRRLRAENDRLRDRS
ncbi:MAG TPA: hypothetical protein VM597_25565 [Gemmataceae bacterium]|jgi:hypothetical protein|nr:hypothetical protein [Gemmataceae bacterium]